MTHAIGHAEYRTERHGRWGSGRARAAIFGLSDGLVSNMGLVAGIAGASEGADAVLVGGVAGLVAGACSMAVGEYVSMKANRELAARELAIERREIVSDPAGETRELAGIYVERGVAPADADHVAAIMMADPERALETHAREELGIDPDELGAPVGAAAASFAAFALGAAIPLLPWVLARGSETSTALIAASLTLGLLAAFVLGALIGRRTGHGIVRTGLRQVGWAAAAFAATYAIGTALGTAV